MKKILTLFLSAAMLNSYAPDKVTYMETTVGTITAKGTASGLNLKIKQSDFFHPTEEDISISAWNIAQHVSEYAYLPTFNIYVTGPNHAKVLQDIVTHLKISKMIKYSNDVNSVSVELTAEDLIPYFSNRTMSPRILGAIDFNDHCLRVIKNNPAKLALTLKIIEANRGKALVEGTTETFISLYFGEAARFAWFSTQPEPNFRKSILQIAQDGLSLTPNEALSEELIVLKEREAKILAILTAESPSFDDRKAVYEFDLSALRLQQEIAKHILAVKTTA